MDLKAHVDSLAAQREALEAEMAHHSQRLEAAGVGLHSSLVDAQARMAPAGHCPVLCLLLIRCLRQGFPLADVDVGHLPVRTATRSSRWPTTTRRSQRSCIGAWRRCTRCAGSKAAALEQVPRRWTHCEPRLRRQPPIQCHWQMERFFARPFAVVDSVAPGSPASGAGVRVRPWSAARIRGEAVCDGDEPVCGTGRASTLALACRPGTPAALSFGGVADRGRQRAAPGGRRRAGAPFRPSCADPKRCTRLTAVSAQASEDRGMALTVRREGRTAHLLVTPQRWSGPGLLGMHLRPLANA